MNSPRWNCGLGIALAACLLSTFAGCSGCLTQWTNIEIVERFRYDPPPAPPSVLVDDLLADKRPAFDPLRIDRRPLNGWQVNQSDAVLRLDLPLVRPNLEPELLRLSAGYSREPVKGDYLPSVNLFSSLAKEFDDGLYAAIEQAHFRGVAEKLPGTLQLVERLRAAVQKSAVPGAKEADEFLAAALVLGGKDGIALGERSAARFLARPELSQPLGFYNWNGDLQRAWRVLKYLQQPQDAGSPLVAACVAALESDPALLADWRRAVQLYRGLSNPFSQLAVVDLAGVERSPGGLQQLRRRLGVSEAKAALFPASTSRETELFKRLFPQGVPQQASLMPELMRRIRSGEVSLAPRANSGWYDHQVYSLETLLLPERGQESIRLLLTAPYKRRMLDAFAAKITKYRETHVRQLEATPAAVETAPPPLEEVTPRLRVEPCPSFYLRTARSYAFLEQFLGQALGEDLLSSLTGLSEAGDRGKSLATELREQRRLFLGLYLVSCDDIGHAPELAGDEAALAEESFAQAESWLSPPAGAAPPYPTSDTRVAAPIYFDPIKNKLRLWVTLGVRRTPLEVSYVRPPRVKTPDETAWKPVESQLLQPSRYTIEVEEFAEVELSHLHPPTRAQLRQLCDQKQTKDAILQALETGRW